MFRLNVIRNGDKLLSFTPSFDQTIQTPTTLNLIGILIQIFYTHSIKMNCCRREQVKKKNIKLEWWYTVTCLWRMLDCVRIALVKSTSHTHTHSQSFQPSDNPCILPDRMHTKQNREAPNCDLNFVQPFYFFCIMPGVTQYLHSNFCHYQAIDIMGTSTFKEKKLMHYYVKMIWPQVCHIIVRKWYQLLLWFSFWFSFNIVNEKKSAVGVNITSIVNNF